MIAQALLQPISADVRMTHVSGTNARTTMEILHSHAQPKKHHIASNWTHNSIQEHAVTTQPTKSSVYHLLKVDWKTEPIKKYAFPKTEKTYAQLVKNANG
jgi:hypothetical protein